MELKANNQNSNVLRKAQLFYRKTVFLFRCSKLFIIRFNFHLPKKVLSEGYWRYRTPTWAWFVARGEAPLVDFFVLQEGTSRGKLRAAFVFLAGGVAPPTNK